MSATFACPHCGAMYPVKPVLVGRVVRCTTCRNAFVLRADGHADKVAAAPVENPAPAPAAPPPAAVAPAPAPALPRPAAPAPRPPSPPRPAAPQPAAEEIEVVEPSPPSRRLSAEGGALTQRESRAKLNQQQEEARRSMAGTLANAAAAALQAEKASQESATSKGTQRSKRLATSPAKRESGRYSPVLVVGVGEREAAERRRLWQWLATVVGVVVIVIALCCYRSAPRKALDDFAAPVGTTYAPYPHRLPYMQSRTWMLDSNVLVDLGSVHIGSKHTIALKGVSGLIIGMKNLTYLASYQFWTDAGSMAVVQKTWKPKLDRDTNLQRLKDAGISVTTRSDMQAQLGAAGLAEDDADIILRLIMPIANSPQFDAARFGRGEAPDAIEVYPFHGTHGEALRAAGNRYTYPTTDYTGLLVRFIGSGWSQDLRVFRLDLINS